MSIILGFGSTEEQVRRDVVLAVSNRTKDQSVNDVLSCWNKKAKEYDKQPRGVAPQRYTSIYYYDNTLHFHHINREHPFSPDGWALLQMQEPCPEGKDGAK